MRRRSVPPPNPNVWESPIAKVLLVDDDSLLLKSLTRLLEGHGHEVVRAEDGSEALGLMDETVALVVTDLHMPRMGGIELARELRVQFPSAKLLMMSGARGFGSTSALLRLPPLCVRETLEKPLDPSQVSAAIERLVDPIN